VESDSRAVAYAQTHFGLKIEQSELEDWNPLPNEFHAVSAFHVLEHVRNPSRLLKNCHIALRQDGKLLIRVPNLCSFQARVFSRRWKGLEVPRHVHNFSTKSLITLLNQNGFRVLNESTWAFRDGPPGLSSSLFPYGEPTRQAVLGIRRPAAILAYLSLTWLLTPVEVLAALLHRGGMNTMIAVKDAVQPIDKEQGIEDH